MSKTDDIIKAINKMYKCNTIYTNLDEETHLDYEFIPTRSIKINEILGGGVVRGRTIEVFGNESSGKSTLCWHIAADHQKYGRVLIVDTEHAFDKKYAAHLGVDISQLVLAQPDTAEQAFQIIESLADSEEFSLIILDSVAALCPRAELIGDSGDSNMGLIARLMGQHLRKITGIASKSRCSIIYVNQLRSKIGVIFGSPNITTGGNALKYFASIRLDVTRIKTLKEDNNQIGIETRVKSVKNKTFVPFQECTVQITHGNGIDFMYELFETAVEKEIIKKSGSWYSYNGENIGQGYEKVSTYLIENPSILESIKKEVTK